MAYIKKHKDRWRAQIERMGMRKSAVFDTKAEAANWAAAEEAALLAIKRGALPRKTLAQALQRYGEEVSEKKKGGRAELLRLRAFRRDFPKLAATMLSDIDTPHMADWRDARLKVVSAGSVQRDINLLSHVFTVARDEWRWCAKSPFTGMRRPGDNPPRSRRVSPTEVKLMCRWLGYRTGHVVTKQQVALAFLIALRTGMRAAEILSLSSHNVDLERRVAIVEHKTQHITGKLRSVPLSKHAVRLLRSLPAGGFTVTSIWGRCSVVMT